MHDRSFRHSAEWDSWKEKIDPFAIFNFSHSVYADDKRGDELRS